jgi:hypothetical protein
MDWAGHLGVILSTLGEDVAFTHGTGTPATIRGVFENPYLAGDVGSVGVSGTNPSFATLTADIGTVTINDTILRGAITYKVRAVRPDDPAGITVMDLRKT